MNQQFNEKFGAKNEKIYSASSHGYLDLMGGIAEYSGSLVLQMPLDKKTTISIRKTGNNTLKIKSLFDENNLEYTVSIDKIKSISIGNYHSVQQLFKDDRIASHIIGSIVLLYWEKNIELTGFEILVESDIPVDKGVGFSAALEVASLKVFSEYYNLHFEGTELPTLAQKVAHLIAKTSCGLVGRLTSFFGKSNHLLPIVCQPDILLEPLPFSKDVFIMGIDSGVSQSLSENEYEKIRTATFMGYSIMAHLEGFDTKNIKSFNREELPFNGYLCNVRVPYYNPNFSKIIPKVMLGKEFIRQYGDIYDTETSIFPEVKYPVLNATKHAIFENSRVEKFQKAFLNVDKTLSKKIPYKLMGSFMDESNMSNSACGLGSEKTDQLVHMAYLARDKGVYGAKISGSGSGGTVAILCIGEKGKQAVRDIWTQYQERNEIEVKLFS